MELETQQILARVAETEGPPLGFTADAVVARGRREVRTRRVWSTVGGAVAVAAVAAVALPLAGFGARGGGGTEPAGMAELAALQQADPQCYADALAAIQPNPESINDIAVQLGIRMCPYVRRLHTVLDPSGTHLGTFSGAAHMPAVATDVSGVTMMRADQILVVYNQAYYSADGKSPFPKDPSQTPGHEPIVVEVAVQAPDQGLLYRQNRYDHRMIMPSPDGGGKDAVPWGPATVSTLPDGTTVSVHKEKDDKGESIEAVRTLKNGVQVYLYIDGPYDTGGGAKTFPYTEAQAVAAISVAGAERVTLPVSVSLPAGG